MVQYSLPLPKEQVLSSIPQAYQEPVIKEKGKKVVSLFLFQL